jgi:thioredoxin-disulfide reductase
MGKIVIVGSGPAGCSAALYAARAGMETTVISKGIGALQKAEQIQNYYGFEEGITGAELYRRGVAGAQTVGTQFVTAEVVGLDYAATLVVQTTAGDYPADAVILATGTGRIAPKIAGLAEHEGRGVSYCATCDAFFYRGKTAAVLGTGEYALHEVQALLPLAGKVILCTNGEPLTAEFPAGVTVCTEKLEAIEGEETVTALRLAGGGLLPADGLFVALGVAGSAALARKLGAPVENSRIVVDEKMQTGIPGLFAAGDCTGGMLQVCKAVYEGALAATEAIKQIRGKK